MQKGVKKAMETTTYRIMQYNILHDGDGWGWENLATPRLPASERASMVSDIISEHNPDILVLCERFEEWRDFCPSGYSFFAPAVGGVNLKETAKPEQKSTVNRNPIYFKSDRFCLLEGGIERLEGFDVDGTDFRHSYNKRVVTWGVLEDYDISQKILVFATHWQTDAEKRAIHARITTELVKRISARYGDALPVIVTADFNERATAPNFINMLGELKLTNCVPEANSVDQIAVRGATPTASGMDICEATRYASDHKPIWCDIVI